MDNQHGGGSAGHAAYGSEPGAWPVLAGIAALVLGTALIWWFRDDNSFAGPLLSASLVATLVAICGWAYDDMRSRRDAMRAGEARKAARYTQVITFAVPEGQLDTARTPDGVIGRIESADASLRKLAGFIDLRIVVSPATGGPSQVLVETSWSDREGLATYEETRRTVLDLVGGLDQQVVPGSAQVFDMVVVRDTKDISVRIGGGAAATLVGALAIGGLLVGAGLTIFEDDAGTASGGGETPAPTGFAATGAIVAKNTAFTETAISLPPNTEVTIRLDNKDASPPHNIQFFAGPEPKGALLTGCTKGCPSGDVATPVEAGPKVYEITFKAPAPGKYAFNCLVHPDQMKGTLTIG